MKPAIQLSVGFDRCSPHKDGSMGLAFSTQELTNEEKLVLLNHLGKFGWLLFKEDDHAYQEDDIPKEPSDYDDGMSPQKRLRAKIWKYWKNRKQETNPDFEAFYRGQIDYLIEQYEEKLL